MRKLRITVGNKSYEVTVEDLTGADAYPEQAHAHARPANPASPAPGHTPLSPVAESRPAARPLLPAGAGAVTSPMAGVIQLVLVKQGDTVKQGQSLVVLEAMKMENQITAPIAGTVQRVEVAVGDSVAEGQVLLVLE